MSEAILFPGQGAQHPGMGKDWAQAFPEARAVFERADEFVLDRSPNPHLAFGLGIHVCLGSTLARMEGRIAVAALLRNLDGIRLIDPDMEELDGFGAPSAVPAAMRRAES